MGGAFFKALARLLPLVLLAGCRTYGMPDEADAGDADEEPVTLPAPLLADTFIDQGHPSQNNGDLAWAVVGSGFDSGAAQELLVRFGFDAVLGEEPSKLLWLT